MDTRRGFLAGLMVTGAVTGIWGASQGAQTTQTPQLPRADRDKRDGSDAPTDNPNMPSAEKRQLEENEKEVKKKVERLYELATELKAEVDKTDSSKVLSLTLLKKTEEIEKLAREIRNRSKG